MGITVFRSEMRIPVCLLITNTSYVYWRGCHCLSDQASDRPNLFLVFLTEHSKMKWLSVGKEIWDYNWINHDLAKWQSRLKGPGGSCLLPIATFVCLCANGGRRRPFSPMCWMLFHSLWQWLIFCLRTSFYTNPICTFANWCSPTCKWKRPVVTETVNLSGLLHFGLLKDLAQNFNYFSFHGCFPACWELLAVAVFKTGNALYIKWNSPFMVSQQS